MNAGTLADVAAKIAAEAPYTGGPLSDFESVGRDGFIVLLENGLRPDHMLLDFGCGALRLGYWSARFLASDRYCGIEPERAMLAPGLEYALGADVIQAKQPRFSDNSDCDMSVFGVKFDYVVARSILTHATPAMLREILRQFAENSNDGALFLASYWDKGDPFPPEAEDGDVLPLADWRFIPFVKYSLETLEHWASEVGLSVERGTERPKINSQTWLRFARPTPTSGRRTDSSHWSLRGHE